MSYRSMLRQEATILRRGPVDPSGPPARDEFGVRIDNPRPVVTLTGITIPCHYWGADGVETVTVAGVTSVVTYNCNILPDAPVRESDMLLLDNGETVRVSEKLPVGRNHHYMLKLTRDRAADPAGPGG